MINEDPNIQGGVPNWYKGGNILLKDLSWINQETTTVEESVKGLYLSKIPVGASEHLSLLLKPISGNFTLTAGISPFPADVAGAQDIGLALRDSATGKIITLTIKADGNLIAERFNSPTSINAGFIHASNALAKTWLSSPFWVQLVVNATLRTSNYSFDGVHFASFGNIARNDWLANIDQCGIVIANSSGTLGISGIFKALHLEQN